MLAVVLGNGVGDLAVVVRATTAARSWARAAWCAYSGGVKAVLIELPVIEKVTLASLLAVGPYAWITPAGLTPLPEFEATIVGRTFATDVTWQLSRARRTGGVPGRRAGGIDPRRGGGCAIMPLDFVSNSKEERPVRWITKSRMALITIIATILVAGCAEAVRAAWPA